VSPPGFVSLLPYPVQIEGLSIQIVASEQDGQALTEFIVVALVLIPLFLLLPMIGKYQDIAHSVQLASRYAAFDAMIRNDANGTWKPEAQLAEELRRRFFSDPDAPIRTNDGDGGHEANRNPFWRDPKGATLIADFQRDVKLSFGPGDSPSHDDAFTAADDDWPFPTHRLLALRSRGIYTAKVSVALANLPSGVKSYEPFDRIDLALVRSTSVVIDPWAADGPIQAEQRFGDSPLLFPAVALRGANSLVAAAVGVIDLPGGLKVPKLGTLEFWRDVVPADRLR